jgi:hypothetical protein
MASPAVIDPAWLMEKFFSGCDALSLSSARLFYTTEGKPNKKFPLPPSKKGKRKEMDKIHKLVFGEQLM